MDVSASNSVGEFHIFVPVNWDFPNHGRAASLRQGIPLTYDVFVCILERDSCSGISALGPTKTYASESSRYLLDIELSLLNAGVRPSRPLETIESVSALKHPPTKSIRYISKAIYIYQIVTKTATRTDKIKCKRAR